MNTQTSRLGIAVASLSAMAALLAGCSLLGSPEPTESSAANDEAALKFVACLQAEGQTAKILDGGLVGMLLPDDIADDGPSMTEDGGSPDEGGSSTPGMTTIISDEDGEWQASTTASGYPEEGGMRDAWAACEEQVPEFEQPEPERAGDSVASEEQMEQALAFAQCARENGYTDFPDPSDEGSMNFPDDLTEDGFRQLLEDCFEASGSMGFAIDKEVADKLDFDLMAVLKDFMDAHPEFQQGATGEGPSTDSGAE